MDIIRNSGIDLEGWLAGFDSVEQSGGGYGICTS